MPRVLVCLAMGAPSTVAGQSVRGWVGSTLQMVELRPVQAAPGGCVADVPCYSVGDQEYVMAATEDLSLTAWGFGLEGVSATVLLRGRARFGSDVVWPRSDDHFDVIIAYGQLVRPRYTLRAGRQEVRSGLGFSSFDGLGLELRSPTRNLRLEAYGGRSLARGLREPDRDALRSVESFIPDQSVYLWGGAASLRLRALSVTSRYQREILADRSGLASERAALDLMLPTQWGRVLGSLDYDFGLGEVGKGRLSLSRSFREGRWIGELAAVRYRPYFSMSTIWGFFEPVAYHGVEGRVAWSASASLGAWATGGARRYGDAGVATVLRPLSDVGRRAGLGVRWLPTEALTTQAEYQLEWGPGGFLSSFDASVRMQRGERLALTLTGTTFQQIEQFRLGDGRGVGAGISGTGTVTRRIEASGGFSLLRHAGRGEGPVGTPWNQSRAWLSVRAIVGDDPGLTARRRR